MKIYKVETNNIMFAGDLHGEFMSIKSTINRYDIKDCAIVICGDIGLGFEKEEYYIQTFNKLTKTLKKNNVHCYFFRGNHDDKSYFDGEHFTEFEYIHVIPDYSVLQTPTNDILCIGGGISVDRTYRQQSMDLTAIDYMKHHNCSWATAYENCKKVYWEDETILFNEEELKQINDSGINIDTVCTHTAPSFCHPFTKDGIEYWLACDKALDEDLVKERKTCDLILDWLKGHDHNVKRWFYGHFHMKHSEIIDDVRYTLLDMCRNSKLDVCY